MDTLAHKALERGQATPACQSRARGFGRATRTTPTPRPQSCTRTDPEVMKALPRARAHIETFVAATDWRYPCMKEAQKHDE